MKRFIVISVLILTVFAACSLSLAAAIPAGERQALIALYNATAGDTWTNNSGWKTPPLDVDGFAMPGTENTWFGVTLDAGNATVLQLGLASNNLVGTLPASLDDLSNLQGLVLTSNQLTGSIPAELGNLNNLQQLWLNYNQLAGSLPPSLGDLSNLEYLYLWSNQLTGSIPTELGNLSNLKVLCLWSNQLTGSIPPSIGNLSKLEQIWLNNNQLTGSIPSSLGNLNNLKYLYLFSNQLSGSIPPELGNLSSLEVLCCWSNHLTGSIPPSLGNATSLQQIWLNDNQLTGSLPPSVCGLLGLKYLFLQSNQFTGSIPTSLTSADLSGGIDISYNALHATDAILINFLNLRDPDWAATQTIAPANVLATTVNSTTINLTWDACAYSAPGSFRIFVGTALGGPFSFFQQTADKLTTSLPVTGLNPGTPYYFVIQTRTNAQAGNQNIVDSDNSGEAAATTLPMHTVRFIAGSGGTISGEATQVVEHGSDCSAVTAVASAGYHFVGWVGEYTGTENPLTITNVTEDTIIFANFDRNVYTVTFVEGAHGTISGAKVQSVMHGGSATQVEALASTGYAFVGWTGGYAGISNPLIVVNVTSNLTITANFAVKIPASERAALIALYNSTNGDSWTNNTGWKTPPLHTDGFAIPGTEMNWHGITVSAAHVREIYLYMNHLVGSLPEAAGNLPYLTMFQLGDNHTITGPLPASIGNLTELTTIYFHGNNFSGSIPPSIGNLTKLQTLCLSESDLSGTIPSELGNLVNLVRLTLDGNRISGAIPSEFGNLNKMTGLWLRGNNFQGAIPATFQNLTLLVPSGTDIGHNALYSSDTTLTAFLNSKDPDWAATQTIAPANIMATPVNTTTINLTWDAIAYTGYTGGYRIFVGTTPGGPYSFFQQTANKTITSMPVTGLNPGTPYYFVISTRTNANGVQWNLVDSENSPEVSTTTVPVYTVNFAAGPNGTLSGSLSQTVEHGSSCTAVTAVPAAGYYFVNWTGDYNGTDNPLTLANVTANKAITANFAILTYSISGTVTDGVSPVAGAVMNGLPGNPATDASGYYSATVNYGWSGSVTPSLVGYTFTPADRVYTDVTTDQTTQDFAAILNTFTISGTVTFEGSPRGGVTMNGLPGNPVTDATGNYSVTVDHGWSGTVTPTRQNFTFSPGSTTYTSIGSSQVTNYTAYIITQALVVENPNSASIWEKGRTYAITWLKQGTQNANVKITLYKGASTLVKAIATTTPNDGSYDWLVPTTLAVGNTYFIRVQTVDNLLKDDSDKFSIIVPTITVTAPTTGTTWVKNAVKTIAWSKLGTQDANVKIQLYMSTTNKLNISLSAPNNGSFDWLIPPTLANGTYTIRITTLDGKVQGVSKGFAIAAGMIKVTAPTVGAKWFRGMPWDITWISEGAVNASVKIQLYKGTTLVSTISASTPTAAGIFNWAVPAAKAVATTYSIKITALDNLVSGKTGSFSILPGAMTVTAPSAGTVWQRGLPHIITWTKEGDLINANVKIQLFKGTTLVSTIVSTTPNDGSYEWTIPAAQALATTYKIRVTTVDNLVQASSGAFTISSSVGLRLTTPNGGELLKPVETQAIRWSEDPDVLEVKLEFSRDNGSTYTTITDHVPNTGSYDWLAPINFTRNGMVRVSDASGRPWSEDGLLEFNLKFIYSGEGEEPGAVFWFGGSDPKNPGYGFAKIGIGGTQVQFGGFTKAIDPLAGNWHELRVRFDFRRDTAEIKLDDQPLFENAPLGTTREHYFQPNLVLQSGGEKTLDFMMDDMNINVVQLDIQGNDKQLFNALNDDFDRYDDRSNPLQNCWHGQNTLDKANKIEINIDSPASKTLRLRTEAGKQILIFLPFSLPDKVPFDISDKCFTIENQ